MRLLYFKIIFLFSVSLTAQVGIGTTTPNASSVLDVSSSNKGVLLPRVGLVSSTDVVTVSSPIKGLIVYNKGTAGLTPAGLYRWSGTKWNAFVDESSSTLQGGTVGNSFSNTVVSIRNRPVTMSSPMGTQLLRYNGTSWVNSNDVSSQNWLLTGNTFTNNTHFLGTTDDTKMTLRSFNQSFFEFGRRQTLGLTQGYTDYTDNNQLVTYVRSAIQFEAPGASYYKPLFFVTNNGNFRLKGSAAGTDYFELGAGGTTSNDGSVEFIIGDDGEEPIVFEKFNTTASKVEMFRMQGTGLNNEVRVGLNNNGAVANSVFQTNGSVAKSIVTTSSNITLNENQYTVVFTGGTSSVGVTLPSAASAIGRTYVIRNTSGASKNISTYINESGSTLSTIPNNSVIWIQSDGSNWLSI
ncbi:MULTISPECIES: hypothetical protein [Flavobacterium]|uniref:Uncharacterized protein n=1 Tax=Flavobacterium jumunjinense TaxID=998845 RepID=A0ABV5GUP6_9FLAO|nr:MULTISPECIES: hypothetical protein [Flavobacterium]